MSKMSNLAIEQEELEMARTYVVNEVSVGRDEFIMRLCLAVFNNNPEITDFRGVIDIALKDEEPTELLCFGEDQFFSYITPEDEGMVIVTPQEEHPLKKYRISYDISIVPLIASARRGQKWKRMEVELEATSFRQAKNIFKEDFEKRNPDRKIKKIEVNEA